VGTSTGGVGKHVLSLGTGLARRGHRVAVLGPAESDHALGFTEAGLRFFPVRIGASPTATDPTAVLKLRTMLKEADTVHAHGIRAGALCSLAGVPPIVVDAHKAPHPLVGPPSVVSPAHEKEGARREDV